MRVFNRLLLAASLLGVSMGIALRVAAIGASYSYDHLGRLTAVLYDDNTGEAYTYDPAGNRAITYTGNPSVFSLGSVTVNEGSTANLTVTRAGSATTTSTVRYRTLPSNAVAVINFTEVPGPGQQLSFTSGMRTQPVAIPTADDNEYNAALQFIVRLSAPSENAALGTSVGDALVTINNTDPAPVFSVSSPAAVNEGGTLNFIVTKTNATALAHSVSFSTSPGTASQGADYTAASGTLTFAPSDTSKTFSVVTLGDALYENSEGLAVVLSEPTAGALLGTSTTAGTITNTTAAPSFSVNSPPAIVEGQTLVFTITRSGGSGLAHSINYGTANGTGTAGVNYTSTSGTLNFPASVGTVTQTVSVPTRNDGTTSPSKTFSLNLNGATNGATISNTSGIGTIDENNVAPGIPASIATSAPYVTGGSYTISWTAPAYGIPTYYQLYSSTNQFTSQNLVYSGSALSRLFNAVDTGNAELDFRVRACNAVGCGGYTAGVSVLVCINGICD